MVDIHGEGTLHKYSMLTKCKIPFSSMYCMYLYDNGTYVPAYTVLYFFKLQEGGNCSSESGNSSSDGGNSSLEGGDSLLFGK
jgi:hypothetical protein